MTDLKKVSDFYLFSRKKVLMNEIDEIDKEILVRISRLKNYKFKR